MRPRRHPRRASRRSASGMRMPLRLVTCSVAARPVHGPRCPDVHDRMLRKRTHAGKRVRETVRGQRPARVVGWGVGERPKRNAPGGYPRAFACLGDRGDRSPGRRSVVLRVTVDGISAFPQVRPCIAFEARWHVLAVEEVGGDHRKSVRKSARKMKWIGRKNAMCVAMGAHITRDFFGMQTFFSHPSSRCVHARRTACIAGRMRCVPHAPRHVTPCHVATSTIAAMHAAASP